MIGNQIIILLIFLIFTFVNSMEIRKTMLPVLRPVGGDEEVNAIRESIESGWWGKGPKVAEFEKKFAEMVGAKYAVAVNSATSGQDLVLKACLLYTSPSPRD